MSRNLVVPPNFVTLRHLKELKEKREEEERLKKEEEERLRKLKEEEEERERLRKLEEEEDRLRKLEEEEDRLRKLKEEEESLKNPSAKTLESKGPYRRKRGEWGSRWGVKPDAQPSRGGANVEAQVAANGGSGARGSISGVNLEAEVALGNGRSAVEASTVEKLKKKKKKKKKKNWERKKEKEAEMPLGLNGSDEGRKGFGSPADANGFVKEKKSTTVTLKANRSDKKISGGVSHRPVKVIGSESGPLVADIGKRVSDLKMGGRNRNSSARERLHWAAPSRRGGGGSGSVMMWVKKTANEA